MFGTWCVLGSGPEHGVCSENVRKLFGKCPAHVRSMVRARECAAYEAAVPEAGPAPKAHSESQAHQTIRFEPQERLPFPEAPKPPRRGRPSDSDGRASVDAQLRNTCPGTRLQTARLSADGAHLCTPASIQMWGPSVHTKWCLQIEAICGHREVSTDGAHLCTPTGVYRSGGHLWTPGSVH